MRKKLTVLLVFMLVVCYISTSAFAAKAETGVQGQSRGTAAPVEFDKPIEVQAESAHRGKAVPERAILGYRDAAQFTGLTAGFAQLYEHQHNTSMGRNIARGSDGRMHFAWMEADTANAVNRAIRYNSASRSAITWNFSHGANGTIVSAATSGYANISDSADVAVLAHHRPEGGPYHTMTWKDIGSGSGSFAGPYLVPDSVCDGLETYSGSEEGEWIWPILDTEIHGGGFTLHMLGTESGDTLYSSLIYWRATSFGAGMYGECGHFVDSVVAAGAVVCADRGSDNVAIVYPQCKYDGTHMPYPSRVHSDVVYMESTDDGVTWPTTPTKITNYPNEDSVFNLGNMTALYTSDGNLHVVWDDGYAWPDEGGAEVIWVYTTPGRLHHWDRDNGNITLVADPGNVPTCAAGWDCGAFNRVVAKPNLTECMGNLYVTYTWFHDGYDDGGGDIDDCSLIGYANGELIARVSATDGITWGPVVNLTNTTSDSCASGSCLSEHWASTLRYNTDDTLSIFYTGDTDPGASTYDEGDPNQTPLSEMKFLRYACFPMETYVELDASPGGFLDPFHADPGASFDTTFTITNTGNAEAGYTHSISYEDGGGWLSVSDPTGSIPPAINNTKDFTLSVTAPGEEGLYKATITFQYDVAARLELVMPVHLYCFTDFFIPENVVIRTLENRLNVQQVSRVGDQEVGAQMTWFENADDMLYDGSLLFAYGTPRRYHKQIFFNVGDTVFGDNPNVRELRALSPTSYDSAGFEDSTYRYAEGIGCTADSVIGFRSSFYASKHPDSARFYVGSFAVSRGPNWGAAISDLMIAYATDWDIPTDSGNVGHVDENSQLVYLQGDEAGYGYDYKYGGIAYRGDDSTMMTAKGGFYWENDRYVYPNDANVNGGYHGDSLALYPDALAADYWGPMPGPDVADSAEDLNCMIVIADDMLFDPGVDDSVYFYIIFAGSILQPGKTEADLKNAVAKGARFICDHINPDAPFCAEPCKCGDADDNGIWNISDAVKLIGYIFGGDPPPPRPCNGDADGNGIVNISDAVYMITYIFGGGPEPGGCDPSQQW